MLKPEEVSKKTQKNKVLEVLGLGVSQFLVFLRPPQVLARFSPLDFGFLVPFQVLAKFSRKILSKPEEVPKKPKFWRSPGPKTSGTLVFLRVFWYLLRFWQKRFWFFWYPLRFWHDFIAKTCGKETASKNERNPGMKDFSLISNEILKGIPIKENPSKKEKSMNEGFLLENPSKNERNPGMKDSL